MQIALVVLGVAGVVCGLAPSRSLAASTTHVVTPPPTRAASSSSSSSSWSSSSQVMRPSRGVWTMVLKPGDRGVAVLTGGLPKKQAKKQRRSRTPVLLPVTHEASGRAGWLRLRPEMKHLAKAPKMTRINCAVRLDGDELILTPRGAMPWVDGVGDGDNGAVAAPTDVVVDDDADADGGDGEEEETRQAPMEEAGQMPSRGARLLSSLKFGDRLEGEVDFILKSGVAVLSTEVYRIAANGRQRQVKARVLVEEHNDGPCAPTTSLEPGRRLECYVRLAEPNSGRLAVSLGQVSRENLRRERLVDRLKKQIKRGSLRLGATRVAVVTSLADDGTIARVHAGGLEGVLRLDATTRALKVHDKLTVKIHSLDRSHPGKADFTFHSFDV